MKIIARAIQKSLEKSLFQKKAIIIYGARQVGKTTLIKEIQKKHSDSSIYLNCDEPDIREALTDVTSTEIKTFIGSKKMIFLDEAQRVKNIGLSLKLIIDNFPRIQVVATGSSSFDLSNKVSEPLTGRKREFYLYPFSVDELTQLYSPVEIRRILEKRIVFGMYPEISLTNDKDAKDLLKNITQSYLYKDVLQYQDIKNPEILEKLLQALALQIGNEVSYNELANIVGINKKTVANYIQILEKAFVIFRLRPFSKNLRKELTKLRKIYFFDTGIRNALINNLNPLNLRQDIGALWENFIISERIKFNNNHGQNVNSYFWRTHDGREIDLIEEKNTKLGAYEIKWQKTKKEKPPKDWKENYKNAKYQAIDKDNFFEFVA